MQQVLAEGDDVALDGIILLVQLAPVAVQIKRGDFAEVVRAVFEGQHSITALLIAGNGRYDVIQSAGYGAVLNVAEQTVLKDCLCGVRRVNACLSGLDELGERNPERLVVASM